MKAFSEVAEQEARQKEKILKVAYATVANHQELKIRELASDAGVYVPLVYKLFGSKSGLVKEIIQKISKEILRKLRWNLDKHEKPFLKLTQYGVNYINLAIEQPQLYTFLSAFRSFLTDNYTKDYIESYNSTLGEAIDLLRTLVRQLYSRVDETELDGGIPRDVLVETHVVELWSSVHGLSMLAMNKEWINKSQTSQIEDRILDAFSNIKSIFKKEVLRREDIEGALDIIATLAL